MPGLLGIAGWRSAAGRALDLVGCSCPDPPDPLVDGDREDHQDAGCEHLVVGIDAREREPAVEDLHDQGTDETADDQAASAEEAGAADHDRGDALQVVVETGVGVRTTDATTDDP